MRQIPILVAIPLLLLLCSCDKDPDPGSERPSTSPATQPASESNRAEMPKKPKSWFRDHANERLSAWLKNRGETDVAAADDSGIGVGGNAIRIKSMLDDYQTAEASGKDYTVETRFFVVLEDGREIVEYLTGNGHTFEDAANDAIDNFSSATLRVFYKAFMNPEDRNQAEIAINIGGRNRKLLAGEVLVVSEIEDPLRLFSLSDEMKKILQTIEIDDEKHWIKVVYSQANGQSSLTSVTFDNLVNEALTEQVRGLDWPAVEGMMVCKQFFIIQ